MSHDLATPHGGRRVFLLPTPGLEMCCALRYARRTMHVYVFGNPDLDMDALPLRLTPALEQAFPEVTFTTLDPNEDWDVPAHMVLIDTVVGIDTVTTFRDLAVFEKAPRVTCHDFDAYANLLLLKKLGKLQEVTIVGVPAGASEDVLPSVAEQLRTVLSNEY